MLMPKRDNPQSMKDLRPIAPCNVANMIKVILPNIVSLNQAALVPGRATTGDVIVAFESIHYMRRLIEGRKGVVPGVLFYSPARGLRQGDPLSPYLFILRDEGSSALFNKAEHSGLSMAVKLVRWLLQCLDHLFFADDSFLHVRVNAQEINTVKPLLQQYEVASAGQSINLQKSGIFFSFNVRIECKQYISDIPAVHAPLNHG